VELSANPTIQEIFRACVFEEALVPVGGEPGTDENAGLVANSLPSPQQPFLPRPRFALNW
jgi:hypothetical protein